MGDPAGIGGELILKALERLARFSIPVIIGDLSVLERQWSRLFQGRAPAFRPLHEGSPGSAEMVEASSMEDVCFGDERRIVREGLLRIRAGGVEAALFR